MARVARGFTLIETVLAVTVIATVTALAAMVWASASSHIEGSTETAARSHTQRIVELARAQWASRRVIRTVQSTGSQDEGLIAFAHDGVSFVTARSVIFHDWPLVQAVYRVLTDADGKQSLVYLETRMMDTSGNAPLVGGMGPDGEGRTGGIVLIEDAEDLRLERFGIGALQLDDDAWRRRSGINFVFDSDGSTAGGDVDAVRIRLENGETVDLDVAVERALYGDPYVPSILVPRWRIFDAEDALQERPAAVRITGNWQGGSFTCVFAARASR